MAAKKLEKVETNPFDQFSTTALEDELARRDALRIKAESDKRDKTWWFLHAILRHSFSITTPEGVVQLAPVLLDILAPTHQYTTCSDEKPSNGWYLEDHSGPRCVRCALVELKTIYNSAPVICVPKFEILISPVK